MLGMQRKGLPGEGRERGKRIRAQLVEIKRRAHSALGAPEHTCLRVFVGLRKDHPTLSLPVGHDDNTLNVPLVARAAPDANSISLK